MESLYKLQMFSIIEIKCDLLIIKTLVLEHLPCAYKEEHLYVNCAAESDKSPVGQVWLVSGLTTSSFHNLCIYNFTQ